jgi:phosphohistidine phosphatase SixA
LIARVKLVLGAGLAAALAACVTPTDGGAERALAALKAGGHYGLMRHTKAPGKGNAPTSRLGDCATQRNLDAAGRAEARGIGEGLRRAGVTIFKVYASRWCRGMETAELLAVGVRAGAPVQTLDILDDLSVAPERELVQTKRLASLVAEPIRTPSVVLVTHFDNIAALTRISTGEGDIVVVKPAGGRFEVVGRIPAGALRD